MTCPICGRRVEIMDGSSKRDQRRRALARHLERDPHVLGVLADYAARYLLAGS